MNTLKLTPQDVLFFCDGRPMSGALAGHTAAWPAPHILNNALHAALHRADIADSAHTHRAARSGKIHSEDRERDGRKFGSLVTAGPFPVAPDGDGSSGGDGGGGAWYFPTPADLVLTQADKSESGKSASDKSAVVGFAPVLVRDGDSASSLPKPLTHVPTAPATTQPAKDNKPGNWLRADAWREYLREGKVTIPAAAATTAAAPAATAPATAAPAAFLRDDDIADIEHHIGIGIDPATDTQDGERIYSAQYLRLRPGWRLGLHAEARDKDAAAPGEKRDLLAQLFPAERHIVLGGQQRVCTVEHEAHAEKLPRGLAAATDFSAAANGEFHVKWVLLSPAIFPALAAADAAIPAAAEGKGTKAHPGGWLPNWIDAETGKVLLKNGDTERQYGPTGKLENREKWRARVRDLPPIPARLVAAIVGKPSVVTGWAIGNTAAADTAAAAPFARDVGAKPVQFAVPAGSIYYFTCDTAAAAVQLAAALNWHGALDASATPSASGASATPPEIKNRRAALLGEKGYGLGVCGTW